MVSLFHDMECNATRNDIHDTKFVGCTMSLGPEMAQKALYLKGGFRGIWAVSFQVLCGHWVQNSFGLPVVAMVASRPTIMWLIFALP